MPNPKRAPRSRVSPVPEILRMLDAYGDNVLVCETLGVYEMRKRLENGAYFTIRYGYRDRKKLAASPTPRRKRHGK
jgi:hypothetical protein